MLPSTGKYVYDKWSAAAGFPNTSFGYTSVSINKSINEKFNLESKTYS